ncbi:MAG: uroporphyrinogen decarboxylase family protein [Armatimonadota bacterium]
MWWASTSKLNLKAPVMFNFMHSWWHRHYGIDFGERMFTDVENRAHTVCEMNRLAFDRFGDIGLGESDSTPTYSFDDIGNATMAAAMGAEVVFYKDQYPEARPLAEDQVEALSEPEDITRLYPINEIIRQADYVRKQYGVDARAAWNCHGVQNMCVQICGSGFFLDYYANPDRARRLLDLARHLQRQSVDYFATQNAFGSVTVGKQKSDYFRGANCTIPLTGPNIYEDWLLEYEQQASAQMAEIGRKYAIHHCGKFDDYAELYKRVDNVVWLEIGWGSDLRRALDAFPNAWVQYTVDSGLLMNGTKENICQAISSLVDAAGPDISRVSLSVPDIEFGTPDENVKAVVDELLP